MKYYKNIFSQLKIYVTISMSGTSKFTTYVTMNANVFFIIIKKFFTNPATVTLLKQMFLFCSTDQIFLKVFVYYISAIFILLKNYFNKFKTCIFTSVSKSWFSEPIINTNNFVSKTTRNVILIFFCVKTFIAFNTL